MPVLTRLHHEWQRITARSRELGEVRRWDLPGMPVVTLDDILHRCGYSAEAAASGDDRRAGDEYLLRLVQLARVEVLAGRIVLQRILPPLCAVARRHTSGPHQRHDLMDELIANAWPVIRNYPTDRRDRWVAANLVRDITFETIVRPARRRCSQEVPTAHDLIGDQADLIAIEPLAELIDLLRDAHDAPGVSEADIAFICQLINLGKAERMAVALDVSPRTVRNHRDAVVHRLRTVAGRAA